MDIRQLTTEQRERVLARGLALARRRVDHLPPDEIDGEGELLSADALALAALALDDGRRVGLLALEAARNYASIHGRDTDDVHVAVLREIDYAVARLSGALSRRVDAETMDGEGRAEVCRRALKIAEGALEGVDLDGPLSEPLSDVQTLALALEVTVERVVSLATVPRGSRCSWCHLAAGATVAAWTALPATEGDAMVAHALECPHSPGAAAVRALRALDATARRRPSILWEEGRTLSQQLAIAVAEIDRLTTASVNARLLADGVGQQHERDCPDALSPHATCPEPNDAGIVVRGLRGCARCGGDHDELRARPFVRSVETHEAGGVLWTHWATCPTTGDPVLVATTDKPGAMLTDDVVEGLKDFADAAEAESQLDETPSTRAAVAWLESRGWRRSP